MKQVFIISGYGVPKDIFKDRNYNVYLNFAFNAIYDKVAKANITKPLIIFTGGKTDLTPPYKRSEAGEMQKLFKSLCQRNKELKLLTEKWQLIQEAKSVSSPENILFSFKLIQKKGIKKCNLHFICEHTRSHRVAKVLKKVFSKTFKLNVLGIDFDISPNRYLDPKFIKQKERKNLAIDLWALKNERNMKIHHQAHTDRVKYFRQAGLKGHIKAIQTWWQEKLIDLYGLSQK